MGRFQGETLGAPRLFGRLVTKLQHGNADVFEAGAWGTFPVSKLEIGHENAKHKLTKFGLLPAEKWGTFRGNSGSAPHICYPCFTAQWQALSR